eukprot:4614904-Prymnesium_polylepis.1
MASRRVGPGRLWFDPRLTCACVRVGHGHMKFVCFISTRRLARAALESRNEEEEGDGGAGAARVGRVEVARVRPARCAAAVVRREAVDGGEQLRRRGPRLELREVDEVEAGVDDGGRNHLDARRIALLRRQQRAVQRADAQDRPVDGERSHRRRRLALRLHLLRQHGADGLPRLG